MIETLARVVERLIGSPRVGTPFHPTEANPFPAGAHPLDHNRSGLNGFGKAVCLSVTEALLADEVDGRLVPGEREVVERSVQKLDLWLGTGSLQLQNGFLVLCGAMQAAPLITMRKTTPFTRLSLEDRLHVLEKLEEHEIGLLTMLLTAFKVPLVTAAYEDGPLLKETGFDRPDLIVPRVLSDALRRIAYPGSSEGRVAGQ
ncbi:MAG: hypothetical protein HOV80_38005 [Polyangiaceae bacterium]|nr:hypothetical protein [Polyangiaceae bacterium]